MKFTAQVLSVDEQARIHAESLRILSEVGVRYLGRRALPLLKRHGARVDEASHVARLPQELVAEALASTPRSFVLGARNPANDYPIPSPVTRYCIDGTAAFVRDFASGERRYGTKADIRDALRVFQQMDLGVMAWAPTCASESPAESRALHEFFTTLQYSSKHVEHELHFTDQVPFLVDGLVAVAGSKQAVQARHAFSLIYCPVAPLMHDGQMLDAYLELGELDLPVQIMPMPATGTTGPASLFGNVCVANAEALSAIVIYQLAHPGRPLIYSNATGTVDLRNGMYLGGSPEMGLMGAALTQMGRSYGLPTGAAGCTADAKQPGPEAVLEKLVTTLPAVQAGTDIITGFGEMESDQLLALEQIVVDNELAHYCERLVNGIDSGAAKDLYADIAQVGPGGNYLKSRSTRLAARSDEFLYPVLADRHTFEGWQDLGKPSMYSLARQRVEEILAGPLVDPLPEATVQALDEILAAADRALAKE